jgi:microcystin degradation protein MlrC
MLHGAMVTESLADPDAEWVRRVREHVGADVPIVATADFHGNITPELIKSLDGLIGYDTYPHTDFHERAMEAACLLDRILENGVSPVMRLAQLPIMPHLLTQFTGSGPMSRLMDTAIREERRTAALWASVFGGFAWADVPHNGISIVVGTNNDPEGASELAQALAGFAWSLKDRFLTAETRSPQDAVAEAMSRPHGPVILVDTGDNVGGGASGDYPVLLRELQKQGARDAVVAIADPETVEQAISTGVRNEAEFFIGGKADPRYGEPVPMRCRVRTISDGVYLNIGEMRNGITDDMGRTAVLQHEGITIVATERKMPMWNLQQLRSLGIEPTRQHIIVVKGAIAHRAAYEPIASRMISVNSPGITALDVREFEYSRVRRPVLPLDEEVSYTPSAL